VREIIQASRAFQSYTACENAGRNQPLRGSADMEIAAKICHNKVFAKRRFVKFKRKIVAVSDLPMDDESYIDSKWMAGI
jgi:hypothetical protein